MALASVIAYVDITRRRKTIGIKVTPSANYVAGGDTLDLTQTTNPSFLQGGQFGSIPDTWAMANDPGGYSAKFIPGTTLANGKLQFFASGGAEFAAGAYAAALTGETTNINFSVKMWSF